MLNLKSLLKEKKKEVDRTFITINDKDKTPFS